MSDSWLDARSDICARLAQVRSDAWLAANLPAAGVRPPDDWLMCAGEAGPCLSDGHGLRWASADGARCVTVIDEAARIGVIGMRRNGDAWNSKGPNEWYPRIIGSGEPVKPIDLLDAIRRAVEWVDDPQHGPWRTTHVKLDNMDLLPPNDGELARSWESISANLRGGEITVTINVETLP